MTNPKRLFAWLSAVTMLSANPLQADEPVDYLKQIKPVLQERCFACHGVLKQKSDLRLDTVAAIVKGGREGPGIDLKNPAGSLLVQRVTSKDETERMPPEGEPLTAAQVKLLNMWIAQGAKGPPDEQPERDPRDHWAFKTPVRPAVPKAAEAAWNRNSIDAFLAAKQQSLGLKHQPMADKRVWLRRVYLDLIGLPPTRAEIDAFLADTSPQAMEKVVDRLLESPQYGERWGRHWMDIWRYSDWWGLGAEVRNSQKHIWHWRDWIIESLNADKGYDQMLREMLAADELYPNDLDKLRASGFLARQYFKFNRTSWLDETIEHTSKAMLGLTVNCCKCHDHKYDPISQMDYYRMRAIFEPYQVRTDLLPGLTDIEKDGLPRAFDCNLDAKTFLHIRGDDRNPDKNRVIEPIVPGFLSGAGWKVETVSLPPEAYQPGLRPFIVETHIKAAEQKIGEAKAALVVARKRLSEAKDAGPAIAKTPDTKAGLSLVKDTFAADKPDLWTQVGGKWAYAGGKLIQSQAGTTRAALKLKQQPPENFEATLKFQTIGGEMWKSVGIVFDSADPAESLAYASAYAGGSKTQISYNTGGGHVYPADGLENRKIELNKPYEMTLRVRGSLVNLLINGQLSVAYRLPVARRKGELQLITFDAKAEFTGFELKELPAEFPLVEAKAPAKPAAEPLNREQALQAVTVAEKTLAMAEAQPAAIRARAAAEHAKYRQPPAENAAVLAREAVRLERLIAVMKAESDVATAAPNKKAEAEKNLTAARKLVETTAENFTPLIGAMKTLENNLETEASRSKPFPTTSTGRRTAFAKWLTDAKNPLPARVAVNHIWTRHFGKPLVPTVFDFGRKGTPPTHPELLDWLAVELVEHHWSMKHLHRLMVTSQAYQMTSSSAGAAPEMIAKDPDNRYYWRANPVRMESQVLRDSLLHLAGELDLTRGGPSIPAGDEASRRRSLYFVHSHNEHQTFLSVFDDASVLDCYRRAESIVPQQALALENSQLAATMAEKISRRITAMADHEFIREAFLTVLCLEPTEAEQTAAAEGLKLLVESAKKNNRPNPEARARTSLIQALLNHNDFVTIR
ncbi:PSD1 and planctomycete cytochrome C domain-containing protein [Zavarzinella formosa]|uniref:PSD1 and planctomycete cytochrome C domain-containing protein n=1 Tax=Zavarzinella formosa TaxID=360055 RepID=UPI0003087B25|nr:PSD1 and planctomycete cytochrome C domain-containing protein [Zavarzinella formosa]